MTKFTTFKKRRSTMALVVVGGTLAMIAAGFWVLISPTNPLTRLFRSAVSAPEARVITGPYPTEEDLDELAHHGVTTVVSLLDPQLPYEGVLLERERDAVAARGLAFHNFPMASVFGRRMGSQYDANADAAAKAVAEAPGKVYMHCYLGMHRVRVVAQRLTALTATVVQKYVLRQGERGKTQQALDQAQAAFDQGRYAEALALLKPVTDPDVPALVLGGWAAYRVGDVAAARDRFEDALNKVPGSHEALRGLGYCAFQDHRWPEAARYFETVLKDEPADAGALYGLALVRQGEGRPGEAVKTLRQLLAVHPDHQEGQVLLKELEGR